MAHFREARSSASEIKFLVDPVLGERIRTWARTHLEPDPHGTGPFGDEYLTTSVYFDTRQFDVLSRRGSFSRAKFRVRRYAQLDFVFLERKLRRPGIVVKRRTQTPIDELHRLTRASADGPWLGDWFHRRLLVRALRPVCRFSYHRTARGMLSDGISARMTLDDALHVTPATDVVFHEDRGTSVLDGQLILELKFRGPLPSAFKRLVEEFRLAPQAVSKYRCGMAALGYDHPVEASVPVLDDGVSV
jgi:SPX domain protein involved in polyphosphate accumulation